MQEKLQAVEVKIKTLESITNLLEERIIKGKLRICVYGMVGKEQKNVKTVVN